MFLQRTMEYFAATGDSNNTERTMVYFAATVNSNNTERTMVYFAAIILNVPAKDNGIFYCYRGL